MKHQIFEKHASIHKHKFNFLKGTKFRFIAAAIALLSFVFLTQLEAVSKEKETRIAVTQITSHESLDKVYRGINHALERGGYSKENIMFANAQGDIGTAIQIASKFVSSKPDVIIAIATPSAQTCLNAIKRSGTPLVFATVSDPLRAQLVSDLKHPGKNVTGTRNVSPFIDQLILVRQLMPKLKTLGVVINSGEDNSVSLVKALEVEAKAMGIKIVLAEATDSAMVAMAATSVVRKVDGFFLLQDNTVASALPSLLQVANASKVPVFSSYVEAVKKGALMGLAFDEFEIGVQTGEIAVRILRGEKAGDIAVEDPEKLELALNRGSAKALGIKLPEALLNQADLLY